MSSSVLEVVVTDNDPTVDRAAVRAVEELALATAVRRADWLSQGYCHLALGLACRELGDHKRARQQLAEGAYILRALGVDTAVPVS
ncbi:hypothetical protein HPO96_09435 [Kribbella sandramycini]|uniref:Tetratricopeptide repeat protein n=1 Tax=Kribbella sandramycini TaxID=60450 RepID=A0A7Y4KZ24_9ACTN|nr:hypothetical protein [Kribbella sandramycini]MBB6569704.1 hypothetical protein [Kribbella sandramycini]NOL40466.1 hypothetical protein [Kribbella sandramycini]